MGFHNGAESQNESETNSNPRPDILDSQAAWNAWALREETKRLRAAEDRIHALREENKHLRALDAKMRALREENERIKASEAKAQKKVYEFSQTILEVEAEQDRLRTKVRKQADVLGITLSLVTLGAVAFVGREMTRPKTLRERLIAALKG